ncbi:MAG TPA: lysophospholipid acyltransferase family protein [Anaerolineae bacterium]|nr:lysophospholipid acyltransferase family protein [Anaerolineae bacterium]
MNTRKMVSAGWPVKMALRLGRFLPLWGAPLFAAVMARLNVWLRPDVYRHAEANLRHVLGPDAPKRDLRRTLYQLFFNVMRRYYEYFYNMARGHTRIEDVVPPVRFTPETQQRVDQAMADGKGLFILGCHMSNFDLAGLATAQYLPMPLYVLSLAEPTRDIEMFNEMRQNCGIEMHPINPESLRGAMRHLQSGGAAVTGPDYPITEEASVEFFGAPARLPSDYLRIPLRTGSPVMVLATHYEDGVYWIQTAPLIELEKTGDRQQDVEVNLRTILARVEDFIRQHPEEWMMFVPVWDE